MSKWLPVVIESSFPGLIQCASVCWSGHFRPSSKGLPIPLRAQHCQDNDQHTDDHADGTHPTIQVPPPSGILEFQLRHSRQMSFRAQSGQNIHRLPVRQTFVGLRIPLGRALLTVGRLRLRMSMSMGVSVSIGIGFLLQIVVGCRAFRQRQKSSNEPRQRDNETHRETSDLSGSEIRPRDETAGLRDDARCSPA